MNNSLGEFSKPSAEKCYLDAGASFLPFFMPLIVEFCSVIIVGETLISEDLFDRNFCCDLSVCKGACCVQGDSGAPLSSEEIDVMRQHLKIVLADLPQASQEKIDKTGFWEMDQEGELATACLPEGDCVFVRTDASGVAKCAWQMAYYEGKTDFIKPLSCHLYPVRLKKIGNYTAVNVHHWLVCQPADLLGQKKGIPLYQFVKAPLIRAFGEDWFQELELVASARDSNISN